MNSTNCKIIVVDDEKVIRVSLVNFLEDQDFIVFSAESAEAGLGIIASKKIDIGIIDIRLPGIDGTELILKAAKIQPKMKFLIYTGSTDFSVLKSLKNLGISEKDLFRKPLNDMNILVDAINSKILK